jgi:ribonucleoside-diphosphate reductase alpha chain
MGIEFISGYREANTPQRDPVDEPAAPSAPIVKINGHRKATAGDVQDIEALHMLQPTSPVSLSDRDAQHDQFAHFQSDAPACDNCGSLTVRCGTCYRCFNCGNSMGCS